MEEEDKEKNTIVGINGKDLIQQHCQAKTKLVMISGSVYGYYKLHNQIKNSISICDKFFFQIFVQAQFLI